MSEGLSRDFLPPTSLSKLQGCESSEWVNDEKVKQSFQEIMESCWSSWIVFAFLISNVGRHRSLHWNITLTSINYSSDFSRNFSLARLHQLNFNFNLFHPHAECTEIKTFMTDLAHYSFSVHTQLSFAHIKQISNSLSSDFFSHDQIMKLARAADQGAITN